jgi:hypothetical protein
VSQLINILPCTTHDSCRAPLVLFTLLSEQAVMDEHARAMETRNTRVGWPDFFHPEMISAIWLATELCDVTLIPVQMAGAQG